MGARAGARRAACMAAVGVALAAEAAAQEYGAVLREQELAAGLGNLAGPLAAGDEFGTALACLGDLDGDGTQDLVAGAPLANGGGTDRGAVWVLFLNRDGTVAREQRISSGAGGFGVLRNGDHFGAALAALPDLDGDGLREVAVGAPFEDDGGTSRGALWILFLARDGTVRASQKVSHLAGGGPVLRNGDLFGSSITAVGDLDADGRSELVVGATGDDDGGSNRGALWILYPNADGTVRTTSKVSAVAGGFAGVLRNEDNFGSALAAPGDLDADGAPDLLVGAPNDDDVANSGGAVWVLFLRFDGTVKLQHKLGFGLDLGGFDRFGASLAVPGDLDGDGVVDLMTGATGDDDGGLNRGATWVGFLERDGSVSQWRKISQTQGNLSGPLATNDFFGTGLCALGDLDRDGQLDVAAGVAGDDSGATDCGAARVLFLQSARAVLVRNGSGINRERLHANLAPVIGQPWEVFVDCRDKRAGIAVHIVTDRPTSGPITPYGEILIDLRRPWLARALVVHRATVGRIRHAVPPDPTLIGLRICSQALVTGRGGLELTNALDTMVGR